MAGRDKAHVNGKWSEHIPVGGEAVVLRGRKYRFWAWKGQAQAPYAGAPTAPTASVKNLQQALLHPPPSLVQSVVCLSFGQFVNLPNSFLSRSASVLPSSLPPSLVSSYLSPSPHFSLSFRFCFRSLLHSPPFSLLPSFDPSLIPSFTSTLFFHHHPVPPSLSVPPFIHLELK